MQTTAAAKIDEILADSAARGFSSRLVADRCAELLGRRVAPRTASRWLASFKARQARTALLADLGVALSALRGEKVEFERVSSRLTAGGLRGRELRAGEVLRAVRSFILRPNSPAMAELFLAALLYQLQAQLSRRGHEKT